MAETTADAVTPAQIPANNTSPETAVPIARGPDATMRAASSVTEPDGSHYQPIVVTLLRIALEVRIEGRNI
ncbi:hypothetical protein NJ7G_0515 [Natrinema sp. J7-2]|nr:hypothetical protein NJ7G_0515 [Natrinema sp. J7-2]